MATTTKTSKTPKATAATKVTKSAAVTPKTAKSASAKPAVKAIKAVATKPAAKTTKAAAVKPAAKAGSTEPGAAKPKPATRPLVTPEQRRFYVEVAAYYMAERRGFSGGNAAEDWIKAESEIDRLLAEGRINP